jgi:hypothetical protein
MGLKRWPCEDHPVEKAQILLIRMTYVECPCNGVLNPTPGIDECDEIFRGERQPQRVRIHQGIEGSPVCDVELYTSHTGNLDLAILEINE